MEISSTLCNFDIFYSPLRVLYERLLGHLGATRDYINKLTDICQPVYCE